MSNFTEQLQKMKTEPGFIAALDQSGGSTPKALRAYGIADGAWSNENEMFAMVHQIGGAVDTVSGTQLPAMRATTMIIAHYQGSGSNWGLKVTASPTGGGVQGTNFPAWKRTQRSDASSRGTSKWKATTFGRSFSMVSTLAVILAICT